MKKLLLLLLLPILMAAVGDDSDLHWTPPQKYTDGNQLLPEEILYYTVHFAKKGSIPQEIKVLSPATATIIPVPCLNIILKISITTTSIAFHPNATSSKSGPVPYASEVKCGPFPP